MSYVDVGDARINYKVTGPETGEPIVLVMGLGMDMSGWDAMMPYLANYRVLRVDNRGAGESDAPDVPYSIGGMARDTVAVMDAAGMPSAHVYGASLGSMIAQEIALSHRDRVRALILGCPSPGVVAVPGSLGILRLMRSRAQYTQQEMFRRAAPYLFHRALEDPEALEAALRQRTAAPVSPIGYRRQMEAVLRWSSLARLPFLRVPTLVIHGDKDRLIPTINGRIIARLIRGARLHIIRGAGHVYSVDAPGEAAREVVAFLENQLRVGYSGRNRVAETG
ncbi:MAG TPA: alpha/beta fold hydrolase [Candidatus Dormibacteraeota bacterium]|nr:alpha/beta fold hydrolase [Candidatus Dormibacteraeota bacterium]